MTDELQSLLYEYGQLPEYSGMTLVDLSQKSLFGDYPINIAATRGALKEVELLLMAGANVNTQGEHGYTPLHNAVEQGKIDVVKFLIKNNADLWVKNNQGDSPMELAEILGEWEIKKFLASAGHVDPVDHIPIRDPKP